ncbi:ATP-dependent DNA helicase [Lysinibacillus sp. NPDC094177]|uniref:ATP-dependent DNA helicase n=1 Tax=Lysinibacillus sp. NPDC094177 TaxID=3390580 RepID=UPI003CFF6603
MESVADKIFSILEEKIPEHYETEVIRTSQVQMAIDIAAFLDRYESKKIMFIEAPVGTGKSLGSLIPAMLDTKSESKHRVVYATATINLQSQLMNGEVPLLKKLSLVKQPILAKGKSHYFCKEELMSNKNKFTPKEQEEFLKFFNRAETGQRNEFEDEFKQDISEPKWSKVALKASKKECERCDFYWNCPTINHRNNFMSKSNDLIITNHGQLIQSVLNSKAEPKQAAMIPVNPGIIIIDEAHHFIENFLNQLEQSFTLSKLREMKKSISNNYIKKYEQLLACLDRTINKNASLIEGSLQGRYPLTKELYDTLNELNVIVNNSLVEESAKEMNRFLTGYDDYGSSEIEELSNMLKNILDKKYVNWINYDEKKFSMISESFPTDFKNFMNYLKRDNKIIIMSGTLTTNGDFITLLNQWRLNKSEVITKRLNTPFDYPSQALVYVPKKMVSPTSLDYLKKCVENIQELISLTEGRSLILTTAKEHMNTITTDLTTFLKEKEMNLYVQDRSGVERLTNQFKEDETSILVGSGSFFSGFSVPGKSLISVVLTKLPFPVPDDPFLQLIGQGYEDEFFELILFPHMINKLNQAAGRLIRDIKDFGIFTILDPRIFTQNYSGDIQEDLESQGYKITQSFEEVKQFIEKKLKNGAEAQYHPYNRVDIDVKNYLWETQVIKTKAIKKPTGMMQKVNNTSNGVTVSQIEFAEEICEQYNLKPPTPRYKKTPDTLYKYLIDTLYWNYEETVIVENDFPFSDESEQKRLLKIKGSDRMSVTLPKCSKFGCNGTCGEKTKQEICEMLKGKYNAKNVEFNKNSFSTNCTVSVDPTRIIIKHFS